MATLAIKGHPTRGSEVIALLEMLGGENTHFVGGVRHTCIYFIGDNNDIQVLKLPQVDKTFTIFTLEEFEEKFPYKVGDKVKNARINDFIGKIINVRWDNNEKQIIYVVEWDDVPKSTLTYFAKGLQPYKEKTIQENIDESFNNTNQVIFETQTQCCDIRKSIIDKKQQSIETITIDDFKANTKEWLIDKLESMSKDDALQSICNIYDALHTKYPKTYEECCNILERTSPIIDDVEGYKCELLIKFQKLLVCRDAYWKIAGNWKPFWNDLSQDKYSIFQDSYEIKFSIVLSTNIVLSFPTEEMRDSFYENFKDLIEQCKELL